jgi:uncharacterized protein YjbI with pentapeptide repeats
LILAGTTSAEGAHLHIPYAPQSRERTWFSLAELEDTMDKNQLAIALAHHALWLEGVVPSAANLSEADLKEADLKGANLAGANLMGANLMEADLAWANLAGANLAGADLGGASLEGANLEGAYLEEAALAWANLAEANLKGANLAGADLELANLAGANLAEANLKGANLAGADLELANLAGANLMGADLVEADLELANLAGANLMGADLVEADLVGADLVGVIVDEKTAGYHLVPPASGSFTAWKGCRDGVIVELMVPATALRSSATTNKCRAEFVEVIAVYGADYGVSIYDIECKYVPGSTVSCDFWDKDRWMECGRGIHFFMTREEAYEYVG